MRNTFQRMAALAAVMLLLATYGCGELEDIASYDPITDPDQLFMSLTLNHHAVNLALTEPYNQVQLVATPRNGRGEVMNGGLPPVRWLSSDTTRVYVTQDGFVTARGAGTNIRVTAEVLTPDNIRRVDTAWVNVTSAATPPQITTFSIAPIPPAEPIWAILPTAGAVLGGFALLAAGINVSNTLTLRVLNENDAPVSGLQVRYESLDPDIVGVHPRTAAVTPVGVGEARVVARTFAYGVTLADTVTYTVLLPRVHGVPIVLDQNGTPTITNPSVIVRPGGYVFWQNQTPEPIGVEFEDPSAASEIPEVCTTYGEPMCGGGNIAAFSTTPPVPGLPLQGVRGRQFHTPGTYRYTVTGGLQGEVVVMTEEEILSGN